MAFLVTLQGPTDGQRFPLEGGCISIGRQPDANIYLDSLAVSRQHAQVLRENEEFFIEDVGSSNGTYLNGQRLSERRRRPLNEEDMLQIGPYVLALRRDPPSVPLDAASVIRSRVDAHPSNHTLFAEKSNYKLQMVLEIAQHLGHTLDLDELLAELLDHLLDLFPQADRGMVLLCEQTQQSDNTDSIPAVRVHTQRGRHADSGRDFPYSRSLVNQALKDGAALLSEDVGGDSKLKLSSTMVSLKLRSFLCVPLMGKEGTRLGVIQLDSLRPDQRFHHDDLELLTAICLHVAVVLENASLHAEHVRQVRLQQELMLAREIQQAFLPQDFSALVKDRKVDLFAQVHPAREVSGDLYDFIPLPDGRLVFYLGDVAGKGMPAALFMIAVRTLARHLGHSAKGPAELMSRLHTALIADNPTSLYVTMACGIYDPASGQLRLASAGHPPPLLLRPSGQVDTVEMPPNSMLGSSLLTPRSVDIPLTLALGETLVLYSDGMTEPFAPDEKTQFGIESLSEAFSGQRTTLPLKECASQVCADIQKFTGESELQDDQTLLLLRRC